MRVLALLSILVACTVDTSTSSDPTSTTSNTSTTSSSTDDPPTSGPIPESCSNGIVDPDERCDGGENCDIWCQEGAFVFGTSQQGFALGNFEIICNFGPINSTRKYVPYFSADDGAMKPTPLTTGGYSSTCKLPAVEPAKWQSLAALGDVKVGELCGHHGESIAAWDRIWLSRCVDGFAMFREANGDVVKDTCSPYAGDPFEALVLCVAQP